jgi:hypothetical protein
VQGIKLYPIITKVKLSVGREEIPAYAYADTGAHKSFIQKEYFEMLHSLHGQKSHKGPELIVKGVDETGTGIQTNSYTTTELLCPSGLRTKEDLVIVPGLPEQMIWGLELLDNLGCNIMLDPKPARCTSIKGGFSETFTSEEEYARQQKARSLTAAEEIADEVQREKIARVITSQERPGQTYTKEEIPDSTDTLSATAKIFE